MKIFIEFFLFFVFSFGGVMCGDFTHEGSRGGPYNIAVFFHNINSKATTSIWILSVISGDKNKNKCLGRVDFGDDFINDTKNMSGVLKKLNETAGGVELKEKVGSFYHISQIKKDTIVGDSEVKKLLEKYVLEEGKDKSMKEKHLEMFNNLCGSLFSALIEWDF